MTDAVLHTLARVLLRFCSPGQAHAILRRVGALMPPHTGRAALVRANASVRRSGGTCLSRALAVAARAPDVDLVIGVAPRRDQPLFAHAWLELAGEPIEASEVVCREIVRLGGIGPSRRVANM
jgi:hypothetical protein